MISYFKKNNYDFDKVEFINEKLDLPFRYSEYQRELDKKELSKSFPWHQRFLFNLFKFKRK